MSEVPRWVKPVAAGATAVLALSFLAFRCGSEQDLSDGANYSLSPAAQTAACEAAGIVLREGTDHGILIKHPSKPTNAHLKGLDATVASESTEVAGGAIVLPTTDRVTLPAGKTLGAKARKVGFSQSALECLNGLRFRCQIRQRYFRTHPNYDLR